MKLPKVYLRDLILYLNSSRAAPKVGISVSLQQAAGISNLKATVKEKQKAYAKRGFCLRLFWNMQASLININCHGKRGWIHVYYLC
jgi:hypothetical protein